MEQGEGMWEWRRDTLWQEASEMRGLGHQFWATVGIDPSMNPRDLTEPQVARLAKELHWVKWKRLSPAQKNRQQKVWGYFLT